MWLAATTKQQLQFPEKNFKKSLDSNVKKVYNIITGYFFILAYVKKVYLERIG